MLTGAVNLLAAFAGKIYLGSDARLVRKIERDAALLQTLPEAAKPIMEDLIKYEVEQHCDRRKLRADRHIDSSAVAAMVFIAVVTAGVGWGFADLAVTFGWGWWIPFGVVTGFGLLLMLSGARQLFYYGEKRRGKRANKQRPSGQA